MAVTDFSIYLEPVGSPIGRKRFYTEVLPKSFILRVDFVEITPAILAKLGEE